MPEDVAHLTLQQESRLWLRGHSLPWVLCARSSFPVCVQTERPGQARVSAGGSEVLSIGGVVTPPPNGPRT